MLKKVLLLKSIVFLIMVSSLSFASSKNQTNKTDVKHECAEDKDCKEGKICYLAMKPRVCVGPQPTGAVCLRDEICASKNCDVAIGQDIGVCK